VFAGDRLVAQGEPTLERTEVAKNLHLSVTKLGFELIAPVHGDEVRDLRTFAVSGDKASELPRYKG
jgi:hypothetical protein